MITTVTLNPAIDKVVEISGMALGKVHRIDRQVVSLGGKSINVCRILKGLGAEAKAVCFLGRRNLDEVNAMAEEEGIPLEPIIIEGSTRTNVKVVEPDQGYRTTDLNEKGFAIPKRQYYEMTDQILTDGKKSDFIVLSGSLPKGIDESYYRFIVQELKEHTKVIVDADGDVLKSSMEAGPYMIKPNIHELEAAVGKTIDSNEEVVTVCQSLLEDKGITYILVSQGEDGCILIGREMVLQADALSVDVVSTVGAGDSMLAGVIYGMSIHRDLDERQRMEKALSYGVASGAIAVSTQDHKAFDYDTLAAKAQEVTINSL